MSGYTTSTLIRELIGTKKHRPLKANARKKIKKRYKNQN